MGPYQKFVRVPMKDLPCDGGPCRGEVVVVARLACSGPLGVLFHGTGGLKFRVSARDKGDLFFFL